MQTILKGKVLKLGDNINTDMIYPAKFLPITDPVEMAKYSFEGISEEFPDKLKEISFVLAGFNFGCGSSREQAVTCIKYAGVDAVIAKSFSRIFYRNAINQGFPIIECVDAIDTIQEEEDISIDFNGGKIKTEREEFTFSPFPSFLIDIMKAGGLIEYTKKKIEK